MILVTGATGNIGGELVRQLVVAGRPVRAWVRNRDQDHLSPGLETVAGDLNHPDSLSNQLNHADKVFLLGGFADMPGLLAKMRRAGVKNVVLLTSRSIIGGDPTNAMVKMWQISEDAVRSSGIDWTILRPSGFMSNALRWLPQLRVGDLIRAPFANVPIAVIDPADIAAVAAVALTSEGHSSCAYELSGPQALAPAEQVDMLARVLGRDLRFEALSDAAARAELSRTFSPEFVEAVFRFFARGEFNDSGIVPTVFDITGRQPGNFERWVQSHIAAFQ